MDKKLQHFLRFLKFPCRESRANAAALETHVPMNTRGSTA